MTAPHVPDGWRKSSFSGGQTNCVEVARLGEGVAVRDTKNRGQGYFTADAAQWSAFVGAIKADRFGRR